MAGQQAHGSRRKSECSEYYTSSRPHRQYDFRLNSSARRPPAWYAPALAAQSAGYD